MENLPVELIRHICGYLCLHCQKPRHSFVHAKTLDVRKSKYALASMSATSALLRAITQPVFFHYFATGNVMIRYSVDWKPDRGQLPLFIHSLIQRLDLATQVKAL